MTAPPALPIDPLLPAIADMLGRHQALVLQAPPGAGKTTKVPLALLGQPWLKERRIVMLEPRRLAARAAAHRLAALLGEAVGATVGYRMRQDSRVGPATRIEVVTEGVLTRMIQDDPSLAGVGAVLFDEFHERSLNGDLGLALCLDAQAGYAEDLRLLVMSATLDGGAVAALLGNAPILSAEGRSFPVETRYLETPFTGRVEDGVARLVLRALDEEPAGDVLAFLPGKAEIRRAERILQDEAGPGILIVPLHGDLPQAAQDRAIRAEPGKRKVVLATSIAETSLTIEGVRVVVDGGRARLPSFDPRSGMSRLITVAASRAAAEQRAGRAGRLGPGLCYRLWTEAEQRARPLFTEPEIAAADLAPLALDLARWGIADPAALSWLDAPPPANFAKARDLLTRLGALDATGRITTHGRAMAGIGLHPRLAHMVLRAGDLGLAGLACDIAILLSERDIPFPGRDADLRPRLERLAADADLALRRLADLARRLRRQLRVAPDQGGGLAKAGLLVAFAYPDRIAQRRGGGGLSYRMAGGQGAFFAEPQPLVQEEMLAVADLDGERREARIFLAAPLDPADVETHFESLLETRDQVGWNERGQMVEASRQTRLGQLVLAEAPLRSVAAERLAAGMLDGVRAMGLAVLPWSGEATAFARRIAFMRRLEGDVWPDLSEAALLETLKDWLGPWVGGMTRKAHLERLDMKAILAARLDWPARARLDAEAPTHVAVPSGSRVAIDYEGEQPVLAVRLQEMFGQADTPAIASGRVRLLLHLLSPARRPVQVTQDLASFWVNAYKAVKADLKGQYPKHYWPDDPMAAEPTARAKPRR